MVEDCQTIAWDASTITRLLTEYPTIALNALHLIAGRFEQLQKRYREQATERVERRVTWALLRLPQQAGYRINGGILFF